MEIRVPSVSNLINKRAYIIVFDYLNNNICLLYEKYFEEMDHKCATQSNQISMKLPKVKLEAG